MTKKNKILILLTIIVVALCYIFFAVWKYNRPLAKGFEEDQVKQAALNVIYAVNERDFERLQILGIPQFAEDFSKTKEQIVKDYLDPAGEISQVKIQKVTGYRDPNRKEDYAQVTAVAKGAKKDLHYRVFINREGKAVHMLLQ